MPDTNEMPAVQVWQQLDELPNWQLTKQALQVSYRFESCSTALEFIARLGLVAEQLNYHPQVLWRYERVDVSIMMHTRRRVTDLDFKLAGSLADIAQKLGAESGDR